VEAQAKALKAQARRQHAPQPTQQQHAQQHTQQRAGQEALPPPATQRILRNQPAADATGAPTPCAADAAASRGPGSSGVSEGVGSGAGGGSGGGGEFLSAWQTQTQTTPARSALRTVAGSASSLLCGAGGGGGGGLSLWGRSGLKAVPHSTMAALRSTCFSGAAAPGSIVSRLCMADEDDKCKED
jgi:hypothetical protein